MRRWWKTLGLLAGGLASLGGFVASADAQGPPPGAFGPNPNLGGMPAEFPNPAQPSQEPASPFSIRDDGMPNAFSELIDPRPRRPQPYTMTFRTEALSWWITKAPISNALATTTTNFPNEVGALGQPNTQILVPASSGAIDYRNLYGVRTSMGMAFGFLPPIEIVGFAFSRNLNVFQGGSADATGQVLARPVQIINVNAGPNVGLETSSIINVPGIVNGTISIQSRMSFWGVEANTLFNFIDTDNFKTDLLLGYRHVDLYESLDISASSGGNSGFVVFNGGLFPPGFNVTALDVYRTRNAFNGGQAGLHTVFSAGRLSFFSDLKLAMGPTYHTLSIAGDTTLTQPGNNRPQQSTPAGLAALASNSGTTSRSEFSVVPEANLSLSYQLGQHLRIFGGYNVLYWSSVARPGDHINTTIDARGVPSSFAFTPGAGIAPTPPPITLGGFWAQGFFVGCEFGF